MREFFVGMIIALIWIIVVFALIEAYFNFEFRLYEKRHAKRVENENERIHFAWIQQARTAMPKHYFWRKRNEENKSKVNVGSC